MYRSVSVDEEDPNGINGSTKTLSNDDIIFTQNLKLGSLLQFLDDFDQKEYNEYVSLLKFKYTSSYFNHQLHIVFILVWILTANTFEYTGNADEITFIIVNCILVSLSLLCAMLHFLYTISVSHNPFENEILAQVQSWCINSIHSVGLEFTYSILLSVTPGVTMIAKVFVGSCNEFTDTPLSTSAFQICNPMNESSTLPSPIFILTFMTPLIVKYVLYSTNRVIMIVTWLISVLTTIGAVSLLPKISNSVYLVLLFYSFSLWIIYEMEYDNRVKYLLWKKNRNDFQQVIETRYQTNISSDLSEELRNIISNTAHDTKSPCTSILLGLEDLSKSLHDTSKDSFEESREPHLQLIRHMDSTIALMIMSINRSMDFTKVQNKLELAPVDENVELVSILNWSTDSIIWQNYANIVKTLFEVDELYGFTDKTWLKDNILCYISNAAKFTQDDSQIFVNIILHTSNANPSYRELEVQVVDNGPVIKDVERQNFFAQPSQRNRKEGGLGLGLFVLSNRVKALKGGYGSESRKDGLTGSVFWFKIPFPSLPPTSGDSGEKNGPAVMMVPNPLCSSKKCDESNRQAKLLIVITITLDDDDNNNGDATNSITNGITYISTRPTFPGFRSSPSPNNSISISQRKIGHPPIFVSTSQATVVDIANASLSPTSTLSSNKSPRVPLIKQANKQKNTTDEKIDTKISFSSFLRPNSKSPCTQYQQESSESAEDRKAKHSPRTTATLISSLVSSLRFNNGTGTAESDRSLATAAAEKPELESSHATTTTSSKLRERSNSDKVDFGVRHTHSNKATLESCNADDVEDSAKLDFSVDAASSVVNSLEIAAEQNSIEAKNNPIQLLKSDQKLAATESAASASSLSDVFNFLSSARVKRETILSEDSDETSARNLKIKLKQQLECVPMLAEPIEEVSAKNSDSEAQKSVYVPQLQPPQTKSQIPFSDISNREHFKSPAHISQFSAVSDAIPTYVLVVDDSIPIQKMTCYVFAKAGCQVQGAKNGSVAVNMMKVQRYDLVLMDIQMPVMSGIEAVSEIRSYEMQSQRKKQIIIGMSANSEGSMRKECYEIGFDEFAAKPFKYEDILQLYRSTLLKHEMEADKIYLYTHNV